MIVPDPSTFKVLPWSPHSGWLLCDVYARDGSKLPLLLAQLLRDAIAKLDAAGMKLVCGLEVEFYMLKLDEPAPGPMPMAACRRSRRATSLIAHGYQYLTEAPYRRAGRRDG